MTTIKNLSIPKPCSESWAQMTPVDHGRHCQSCCKTVTDFTGMSNKQIIDYLSNTNHVCGRFNEQQVNSINYKLYADNLPATGGWKKLTLVLGMLGTGLSISASAQSKPVLVQAAPADFNNTNLKSRIIGRTPQPDSIVYRMITGHVTDERNEPFPGVMINVSADQIGTLTDMNGNFKLSIPDHITQFTASFIGYTNQTIYIGTCNTISLKLEAKYALLGEVVVVKRASFVKRVYYRFIKKPIRKIFN